ncbi:MAG: ribosome assembly cofactor RimP [Bacteroidetes bacterium]|nr:ribosome assembly cofactor RimP [Bacteroidota bacterium]MBL7103554.1 ribosome assembly cofactor RimP [Bacteroidales bacterium]
MIDKNRIYKLIDNCLEGTDKFLVDVDISKGNIINVFVDGDDGISIDDCAGISRYVEMQLNRDVEDFELRVSSPGLNKSFKLLRQYKKYINREIELITKEGKVLKGILKSVSEEGVKLERSVGKKMKNKAIEEIVFDEIKESKPVILFKK